MLTDSEKKWLEERKYDLEIFGCYYCPSCKGFDKREGGCIFIRCMIFRINWEDCAEFEARVAAKLTEISATWEPCFKAGGCPVEVLYAHNCIPCRLKHARLTVEEEMGNGRTE